jgi:murein DD-endopeptidase MepM/ murein hydrolase activator NlpD
LHSPSLVSSFSRYLTAFNNIFQKTRIAATLCLTLFILVLSMASIASAQTRARRARAEQEKGSRRVADNKRAADKKRVDDKKLASDKRRLDDRKRTSAANAKRAVADEKKRSSVAEVARRDNSKQVVANPLVRKTSLTYETKNTGQPVNRPVLVNDITVVSRYGEKPASSALLPTASKASTAAANIPSIWPVSGTLRSGVGVRSNPFGGSSMEFHKGQDIAAPMGTPVIATADGTIVIAGWLRGYGWAVYIDHGNGISTRYGHLSRIDVAVGQTIRRGEQLGLVGSTGRSTGPHLHYEVRINGQPVSPLLYLPSAPALTSAQGQATPTASAQR